MTCIEYKDYIDTFKFVSKLGDGNCASVVKVQDIKTKRQYALKYSKLDSSAKLALAMQQIEVVRAIDHPGAIQIYYYFVKTAPGQKFLSQNIQFGIIMELADRSFEQDVHLRRKKATFYSEQEVIEILRSLVEFFAHAQQKGYMHRDIKPANILIMPSSGCGEKYKVCDFGFAIKNHHFADKNIAGTASYASPKIQGKFKNAETFISGNNYKDDVYSLGITILQLCTLESAEQVQPRRLLSKVNSKYGLKMAALIQSMIEFQEVKRPDFLQLKVLLPKFTLRTVPLSNRLSDLEPFKVDIRCPPLQTQKSLDGENLSKKNSNTKLHYEDILKIFTPKTNKNGEERRKELSEPFTEVSPSNDKIRTKRRSKLLLNCPLTQQMIIANGPGMPILNVEREQQRLKTVHKFKKGSYIRLLESFEISCSQNKPITLIFVVVNDKLHFCYHSQSKKQLIEVQLNQRFLSIQFLKWSQKKKELLVFLKNGQIISISLSQILDIIAEGIPFVSLCDLNYIEEETISSNFTCVEIDQRSGNILKALSNGKVMENDKMILQTNWKSRIAYIKRVGEFVFLGSFDGTISKFKIRDKCLNDLTSLVANFQCKSSVLGINFERTGNGGQLLITVITSSGFYFRLNQNLETIQTFKIGKQYLRLSSVFQSQDSSGKIISLDVKGNLLNQKGQIVLRTDQQNIIEMKLIGDNSRILLANEEGSIFEASLK